MKTFGDTILGPAQEVFRLFVSVNDGNYQLVGAVAVVRLPQLNSEQLDRVLYLADCHDWDREAQEYDPTNIGVYKDASSAITKIFDRAKTALGEETSHVER